MLLRRPFRLLAPSAALVSTVRCCAAVSDPATLEALRTAVSKQQVALVGLTKKIMSIEAAAAKSPAAVGTSDIAALTDRLSRQEQALLVLRTRLDAIEATSKRNAQHRGQSSSSPPAVGSSPATQARDREIDRTLSAVLNRLAAIEAKQAVAKIAQRVHTSSADERSRSSGEPRRVGANEPATVTMEPGLDNTPRLVTCQVEVHHPTASASSIRLLLESAGPVVSCVRKLGGGNARRSPARTQAPPAGAASGTAAVPEAAGPRSGPCTIVTFQSTVDAVRAIETLAGVSVGGHPVFIEPHVESADQRLVSKA